MNGTGSPTSQPATRTGFRPTRSASAPATRFVTALVRPNATRNDERGGRRREAEDVATPSSGTIVRSCPTIPPTSALTPTSSANWPAFSRRPNVTSDVRARRHAARLPEAVVRSRALRCHARPLASTIRPQWKTRTATSTPNAARTRIAAAAIDASRSPPWNSRVDDERQRLRPALDVAREHDRRPELAERPCPGHDQTGRQRGAGQGDGDRPEQLTLRGPVDAGRVLEIAVDAGDAGPRRPDEERRRHERHGEDHRDRRERDRDAEELERRRQEPASPEDEQQRQTRRPTAAARSAGRRPPRRGPCRGSAGGQGRRRAATRARP